jgi:hypothetical protein
VYGVAEGQLAEGQFDEKLELLKTSVYRPGDLADRDMECSLIHRVSNRGSQTPVSLHLYGVAAERLTTGINRIYA